MAILQITKTTQRDLTVEKLSCLLHSRYNVNVIMVVILIAENYVGSLIILVSTSTIKLHIRTSKHRAAGADTAVVLIFL